MLCILFNGHYFLGQICLTFNLIQSFIKLKSPGETFTGHPRFPIGLLPDPPPFCFLTYHRCIFLPSTERLLVLYMTCEVVVVSIPIRNVLSIPIRLEAGPVSDP